MRNYRNSVLVQEQRRLGARVEQGGQSCPSLALRLIGTPSISWNNQPLRSPSKRALPLLAILALSPAPTSRRELVNLLWSDGRAVNLRQELAKIRKMPGGGEFLVDEAGYERLFIRGTTDVEQLRRYLRDENFLAATELWSQRREGQLLNSIDLSFLPPAFHDWLDIESMQLERLFSEALFARSVELESAGDIGEAIELNHDLIGLDPLSESANQAIIRLEIARGRHHAARRQFEKFRTMLMKELGVSPRKETRDLLATIPSTFALGSGRRGPLAYVPRTKFIGRDRELTRLSAMFSEPGCRLLSIVGLGGIGKTRLAAEFADRVQDSFDDGVLFMPVAHVMEKRALAASMLVQLGLPSGGEEPEDQVLSYLKGRALLIVIDNFEPQSASAGFMVDLLACSPDSRILATSRVPVGVHAEHVYHLRGLDYGSDVMQLTWQSDSVRLFLDRVKCPVGEHDLAAIIDICKSVQGMPLAIELACNLSQQLRFTEIAGALSGGAYEVLHAKQRDVPVRHRSLQSAIEGTWELLTSEEQVCLAKLSVLLDSFDASDANYVADVTLQGLVPLAESSLVVHDANGSFALPEPVRWFAYGKLLSFKDGRELSASTHVRAATRLIENLGNGADSPEDDLRTLAQAFHHLIVAGESFEAWRLLAGSDVRVIVRRGQAEAALSFQKMAPSLDAVANF